MAHPNVRAFLTASTEHLPPRFRDHENAGDLSEGFTMCERGLWVSVPQDPDDLLKVSPPGDDDHEPAIHALRVYARGLDCDYILFDHDGERLEEFPVFE